jgi:hypothetical protein
MKKLIHFVAMGSLVVVVFAAHYFMVKLPNGLRRLCALFCLDGEREHVIDNA